MKTQLNLLKIFVSLLLTAIFIAVSWYIWQETPKYIRRTPLQEYRHLISLLLVYLVLSAANPLVSGLWQRLFGEQEEH